jgi:arylformamidase
MPDNDIHSRRLLSRRNLLAGAATVAATPALAQECRIGPPPHEKGPRVFLDYDQVEIDAAYDQAFYAPLFAQITKRYVSRSNEARARLGEPRREAYGPTAVEKLDIYRARRPQAPIFVYIHGGAWLSGEARNSAFPAELFVNAGAHYVALDFVAIREAGGDLGVMAEQVRRGIAWVYKNAHSFDGDANRLYIGGFSSGGHLCGVALVTNWQKDFGLPADCIKGGLCMSGMYDMKPVRISKRSSYVKFTDEMEQARPLARARRRHLWHQRDARVPAPEPRLCRRGQGRRQADRADRGRRFQPLRDERDPGQSLRSERPRGARADEACVSAHFRSDLNRATRQT